MDISLDLLLLCKASRFLQVLSSYSSILEDRFGQILGRMSSIALSIKFSYFYFDTGAHLELSVK